MYVSDTSRETVLHGWCWSRFIGKCIMLYYYFTRIHVCIYVRFLWDQNKFFFLFKSRALHNIIVEFKTNACVYDSEYYKVPENCNRLHMYNACIQSDVQQEILVHIPIPIQYLLCLSLSSRLHGQVNSTQNLIGIYTYTHTHTTNQLVNVRHLYRSQASS